MTIKKWLRLSLVVTTITVLFRIVWDVYGNQQVLDARYFQLFPGLILCVSIIADLWLWYLLRKEKRKGIQRPNQRSGRVVDILILFFMACAIAATAAFMIEYIAYIVYTGEWIIGGAEVNQ